jgi:hypothetical protein
MASPVLANVHYRQFASAEIKRNHRQENDRHLLTLSTNSSVLQSLLYKVQGRYTRRSPLSATSSIGWATSSAGRSAAFRSGASSVLCRWHAPGARFWSDDEIQTARWERHRHPSRRAPYSFHYFVYYFVHVVG